MGKLADAFKTKKEIEDKKNATIAQILELLDGVGSTEAQRNVVKEVAILIGMRAETPSYGPYDR